MPLPAQLKERMVEVLSLTLDAQELQDFTSDHRELLGGDFDSYKFLDPYYPNRVTQYINVLDRKSTLIYFVKEFAEKYKDSPVVAAFYHAEFKAVFNVGPGNIEINPTFLDCIFLENSLPFIDRDNLKEVLQKLLDGKKSKLLVIDGKSKSGLSYLRWYLKEMASRTGNYQFEYIDMKYILNNILKNKSRVHAYDIADYLNDKLALDFKFDSEKRDSFKTTPFINRFKEKIKNRNENLMLFMDHFDNMVAEDVSEFIYELVNTALLSNLNCYIFLAGYKDIASWSPDVVTILKSKYNNVVIDSFKRDHLELFFKKVHAYLSIVYQINVPQKTFIDDILNQIPQESFDEPNVEAIGSAVTNWYMEFQNNNS